MRVRANVGMIETAVAIKSYHIYFEALGAKGVANVLENSIAI